MALVTILLFLTALFFLVKSSEYAMKSLLKIAEHYRISEFLAGFGILAIATSLPELFVGIMSAFTNNQDLALGTVIGSNIADIALVLGIAAIAANGISLSPRTTKEEIFYVLAISVLPLIMLSDGILSRSDGFALVIIFVFYMWNVFAKERTFSRKIGKTKTKELSVNIGIFVLSLIVLFVSSDFLVKYAVMLSAELLLPVLVIGLFLVSIGTSLPELMVELRAALTRHDEIAVGGITGSVVANSTLVLGVAALINPIRQSTAAFTISSLFMITSLLMLMFFAAKGSKITRINALFLLLLYGLFIAAEFYARGV